MNFVRRSALAHRRALWPAYLLFVVAFLDIALDYERPTITGLTSLAPLLAAAILPVRTVRRYVVAALLTTVAIGIFYGTFGVTGAFDVPQLIRLTAVLLAGLLAVWACNERERRERDLVRVSGIASRVQAAILPPLPNRVGDVTVAARYRSAARDALVGGDLYDAVDTPWGVRLIIGDVRGKGLDAVRLTSLVLGAFRTLAPVTAALPALLSDLDRVVTGATSGDDGGGDDGTAWSEDFVTVALVQIRGTSVSVVTAGHPEPIVVEHGRARQLGAGGALPPLGLGLIDRDRPTISVELAGRFRLLLFTDGLTEARSRGNGEFYSLERAGALVASASSAHGAVEALFDDIREWAGSQHDDDVALLAAEFPAVPVVTTGDTVSRGFVQLDEHATAAVPER